MMGVYIHVLLSTSMTSASINPKKKNQHHFVYPKYACLHACLTAPMGDWFWAKQKQELPSAHGHPSMVASGNAEDCSPHLRRWE